MRKIFHIFPTYAKNVSFFRQNSKSVSICLTRYGKCINFFRQDAKNVSFVSYKVQKGFESFCQDADTIRYFSCVYNFSSVFFITVCKN